MRDWQVLVLCMAMSIGASPVRAQPHVLGPEVVMGGLEDRGHVLAVALHPEYWAAYDVERGSLYRVWKGSLDEENGASGAAVRGQVVQRDTEGEAWRLRIAGRDTTTTFRYLGFRKETDQIVLSYALAVGDSGRILVDETPRLIVSEAGHPELRRRFVVHDAPPEVEVLHRVEIEHAAVQDAVVYEGILFRTEGRRHRHGWGITYDVGGWVVLSPDGRVSDVITQYGLDVLRRVARDAEAPALTPEAFRRHPPVALRTIGHSPAQSAPSSPDSAVAAPSGTRDIPVEEHQSNTPCFWAGPPPFDHSVATGNPTRGVTCAPSAEL